MRASLSNIIASVLALVLLAGGAYAYLYFSRLPTVPPEFVQAQAEAEVNQQAVTNSCLQRTPEFAYQLSIRVTTTFNDQVLYSSLLNTQLQFASLGEDKLAAASANSSLSENQQRPQALDDMVFLARASGEQQLLFSAFNSLGLAAQHPLMMVSQALKNLSVGAQGEVYRFSYDALQRHYRYQQARGAWQRQAIVPGRMLGKTPRWQPLWQVAFEQDCLASTMQAEEIQAINLPQGAGKMRISMQASRIANFKDVRGLNFTANANGHLSWQPKALKNLNTIHSDDELWQSYTDFTNSRNTQQLVAAARYWVDHKAVQEFAAHLADSNHDDELKRDMVFSLGLLSAEEGERYLQDLIAILPEGSNQAELQKVRAMVALSGQEGVSEQSFTALQSLHDNPDSADNIRANALISMASVVKQQQQTGMDTSHLTTELGHKLEQALAKPGSSAAIYAAGNVGLDNFPANIAQQIKQQLSSPDLKSRYAAVTVLSRDPANTELLKQALATEPSEFIRQAIEQTLKP